MRMTARSRIVGWMLAVVALALAVAIFATWAILSRLIDDRVDAELGNEAEKLRRYAATAVDTRDVDTLLSGYLSYNPPDEWETFFTVVDGQAHKITGIPPLARLDTDAAFVARAASATAPVGGQTRRPAGRVRYARGPLRAARHRPP